MQNCIIPRFRYSFLCLLHLAASTAFLAFRFSPRADAPHKQRMPQGLTTAGRDECRNGGERTPARSDRVDVLRPRSVTSKIEIPCPLILNGIKLQHRRQRAPPTPRCDFAVTEAAERSYRESRVGGSGNDKIYAASESNEISVCVICFSWAAHVAQYGNDRRAIESARAFVARV